MNKKKSVRYWEFRPPDNKVSVELKSHNGMVVFPSSEDNEGRFEPINEEINEWKENFHPSKDGGTPVTSLRISDHVMWKLEVIKRLYKIYKSESIFEPNLSSYGKIIEFCIEENLNYNLTQHPLIQEVYEEETKDIPLTLKKFKRFFYTTTHSIMEKNSEVPDHIHEVDIGTLTYSRVPAIRTLQLCLIAPEILTYDEEVLIKHIITNQSFVDKPISKPKKPRGLLSIHDWGYDPDTQTLRDAILKFKFNLVSIAYSFSSNTNIKEINEKLENDEFKEKDGFISLLDDLDNHDERLDLAKEVYGFGPNELHFYYLKKLSLMQGKYIMKQT
tara:strand:+ start:156 stop:1145 length:990 start_codon:yes stop_codon:yes gene_type:complete